MKRLGPVLVLIIILFIQLSGCKDKEVTNNKAPKPPLKSSVTPSTNKQLLNGKLWPPIPKEGEMGGLSENLLIKNYYVVLDGSGSMQGVGCSGSMTKSEASKKALVTFSESVPADDNLGLAAFDSRGVTERVPLGINNRENFVAKVKATLANSNTPLRDAVMLGYKKLEEQASRQLGYGEYHLVIVTDGVASPGQDPTAIVNHIIDSTPIVIHTIGFCIGAEHALNQAGRTDYKTADSPQELVHGLKGVLAEAEEYDMSEFGQ
ncbi:MAG: VWA domain-containing protein [Candidatus Magnetoovum sp. WYHC-5]|nr:VWA domain-containing protein [Candidatus Magnetoovum sp. WYHC-5]